MKWEYRVGIYNHDNDGIAKMRTEMNQLGQQGWEAFAMSTQQSTKRWVVTLTYKRPIE